MLMNSPSADVAQYRTLHRQTSKPCQAAILSALGGRTCSVEQHREHSDRQAYRLLDRAMVDETNHGVQVFPADVVKRRDREVGRHGSRGRPSHEA